jgi:CBS domain-containing protein
MGRLTLHADTAADLMMTNPLSLRADATLQEALIFFTEKGFRAAPVIDDSGRPVGVLSQADIIIHDRETVAYAAPEPEYFGRSDLALPSGEMLHGFQVEKVDRTRVHDLMTPAVFSVRADTPCEQVIAEMLRLHVHRLFVVDDDNTLVGVISMMDILRRLVRALD